MTKKFVTIVRRRVVIEEAVITQEEFNKLCCLDTDEDYESAYERLVALPYLPWDDNGDQDFEAAYMAFAGDVTAFSDDLVSLSANWQSELPLELDQASYFDKLLAR